MSVSMRTYEATPPASATLCCPSVCSVRTYTQILPCSPFRGSEHQMDSGGVTRASSVVSMMFWGFSWTVKSCCWNLWNSLNWTKRTTVTLLLQENDQLCIKSFFQPLLTPTGSAFYFYRCCSSFVHMLLMISSSATVLNAWIIGHGMSSPHTHTHRVLIPSLWGCVIDIKHVLTLTSCPTLTHHNYMPNINIIRM